jgi:hypothetical protein
MAQLVGRRRALALPLLMLLLATAACQPGRPPEPTAEQKAAAARAAQKRLDQQRCLRDRDSLRQQLNALRSTQAELARVKAEAYVPAARPQPPDPALEARFSLADQELDNLRHQQALANWEQAERQRYREWKWGQSSRRQRLEERQRQQLADLKALNSNLFDPAAPGQLSQPAVARYSSCDPARF